MIVAAPTKPRVLLVDDDPLFRRLVRMTIPTDDVEVVEAADGTEAVHVAHATHPALVFLDVSMPGPDGFVVCRQLRADPATRTARIVMLTVAKGDRALAETVGADDYLVKPFSPLELLRIVSSFVPVGSFHENR